MAVYRRYLKKVNQNTINLIVDLVIFLIFLPVEAPKLSGLQFQGIHTVSLSLLNNL
jgi:hypothetical protein